jgi:quercetin dioxygenase-like cupin family protein
MEPDIKHFFGDGLYAKEAHIPAGMWLQKHMHTFTHFSILAKGKVRVTVDESEAVVYEAPACIEIKANAVHAVYAVTDVTWYCVHATNETDEDKIDEVLIAKGA